jgi:hypothetical protein
MKTALEWFIEKLEEEQLIFNHGLVEMWMQQAKEMEKQQIINAYNISGIRDEQQGDGEDYYNYFINDISE